METNDGQTVLIRTPLTAGSLASDCAKEATAARREFKIHEAGLADGGGEDVDGAAPVGRDPPSTTEIEPKAGCSDCTDGAKR